MVSFRIHTHYKFLLLFFLLNFAVAVPEARAHGGGTPQLTNENIGPYWISVWTSPQPVREGQLHVTVAVAEPGEAGDQQAGAPVLGAGVEIILEPRSGGLDEVRAIATNEQSANKLFYEADLLVPAAGDWRALVEVQGPAGTGQGHFDLVVEPPSDRNWIILGGVGLLAVAGFFIYYTAGRKSND